MYAILYNRNEFYNQILSAVHCTCTFMVGVIDRDIVIYRLQISLSHVQVVENVISLACELMQVNFCILSCMKTKINQVFHSKTLVVK